MKKTHLLASVVALAAVVVITADASAMYHPALGRFIQRDPGPDGKTGHGEFRRSRIDSRSLVALTSPAARARDFGPAVKYADGMSLYQNARSNPVVFKDPSGLAVDPGKDCDLWSRSDWTGFIGPIKKPTHFWLNTDAGELWDFGPDYDWLDARYGHHEYGDCTIFKYCRGEANWGDNSYANETGDVNNRPKLQIIAKLWHGQGKGKWCRCATCDDIKSCLSKVRERWDGTRYDHFARHCGTFVLDAAVRCCLWGV